MTNPLRAWIHAHLDAPLDGVYTRIDEIGVDDAAPPMLLDAPRVGLLSTTSVVRRSAPERRNARRIAH